MLGVAVVGF